ncbi:MAG: ParB/RepB/Spo0J family partition protein [Opitutaceae bacterium]
MASPSKSRLGRGLGAIITGGGAAKKAADATAKTAPVKSAPAAVAKPAASAPTTAALSEAAKPAIGYRELPVSSIEPNPYQPRRDFRPEHIEELAESIRAEGLLQPVVVRAANGKFQLVAGERRWRAFQQLKLKTIPARVIEASNASAASMALIENLQRESLNPVEEAHGYASLIRDFDLTQEQVGERVGKGRATVANSLRLLNLAEEIQGYLGTGLLSTGHAKALLGIENAQEQVVLARRIIEQGLSVRATEALVASWQKSKGARHVAGRATPAAEAAAIADIQRRFSSFVNARVELKHAPKKGRIIIEYRGNEDLQRILEKLGVGS